MPATHALFADLALFGKKDPEEALIVGILFLLGTIVAYSLLGYSEWRRKGRAAAPVPENPVKAQGERTRTDPSALMALAFRESKRHQVRAHYLSRAEQLRWVCGPEGLNQLLGHLTDDLSAKELERRADRACAEMDCLILRIDVRRAYEAVAEVIGDVFPVAQLHAIIAESLTTKLPIEQCRLRAEEYKRLFAELAERCRAIPPDPTAEPPVPPPPVPSAPSRSLRREMEDAGVRARRRAADAARDARDYDEAVRRIPEFDAMTAHEKGVHLRPMLERIRRERGENPGAAGEEGGS